MINLNELENMGFKEGALSECIITTYNKDDIPNAAPIGVTIHDECVTMRIHTFTDTYRNIVDKKSCVLNIVYDPYLFIKTAIMGQGKDKEEQDIEDNQVYKAQNVDAPYINSANAYIELKLLSHDERKTHDRHGKAKVSIIKFEILSINIIKDYPITINRALFAAIELAILLSREKKDGTEHYLKIMKKTMASDDYKKIEDLLEGKL